MSGETPATAKEAAWRRFIHFLEAEDDPNEAFYDPVHLGAVAIVNLAAVGALYWLLWTLLVFEGGVQSKIRAAILAGIGRVPFSADNFEGWFGNVSALLLCGLAVAALHRAYRDAAKK